MSRVNFWIVSMVPVSHRGIEELLLDQILSEVHVEHVFENQNATDAYYDSSIE